MKIEYVSNWTSLWKAFSVQLAALGLIPPTLVYLLSDFTLVKSFLDLLPAGWQLAFYTALVIGILFVRPIKQDSLTPEPAAPAGLTEEQIKAIADTVIRLLAVNAADRAQ